MNSSRLCGAKVASALLFVVLTLSPFSALAVNPPAPFSPSDNVLDPGCLPTDSNCYVSISNLTLNNATTTSLSVLANALITGNVGIGTTTPFAKLTIDAGGSNTNPLSLRTNGSVGNYTPTNSGIFVRDLAGNETLRIFASDPNGQSNYNSENLYIGKEAGFSQPTDNINAGYYNTGIGSRALYSNTTGSANTSFGKGSLAFNTIGSVNTAIGRDALTSNINGFANTANGGSALYYNTVGDYNTANGVYSLYLNATGSYNSAFGHSSGYSLGSNGTSSGNLFLGYKSAYNQTKGDYNILLGYNNDFASTTGSNQLNIGNLIYGTNLGINGTLSTGNIGIGTTTPSAKLAITGTAGTNPFTVASSTGSTLFTILENGNVGVGVSNPTAKLEVSRVETLPTGRPWKEDAAVSGYVSQDITALQVTDNDLSTSGGSFNGYLTGSAVAPSYTVLKGIEAGAQIFGSVDLTQAHTDLMGIQSYAGAWGNSKTTNVKGLQVYTGSYQSAQVTNMYGIWVNRNFGLSSSPVQNMYGIYLEEQVNGTNKYNFYSAGATAKNIFEGNVGIGTSSPIYKLHVGDTSVSGVVARFQNSTGYCDINPTTTSLTCTSDVNLKKNIVTLDASTTLANLSQLNAVTYNWKSEDNASSTHAGFIAQEVQPLFPDLVATDANGTLSVSYGGFIPYIIQSIKSIVATITNFKDSFTTKNLCVGEGVEKTCITREQLDTMIRQSGQTMTPQPVIPPVVTDSNTTTDTDTSTISGDGVATTTEQVGGETETASEQATTTPPLDTIAPPVTENNQDVAPSDITQSNP